MYTVLFDFQTFPVRGHTPYLVRDLVYSLSYGRVSEGATRWPTRLLVFPSPHHHVIACPYLLSFMSIFREGLPVVRGWERTLGWYCTGRGMGSCCPWRQQAAWCDVVCASIPSVFWSCVRSSHLPQAGLKEDWGPLPIDVGRIADWAWVTSKKHGRGKVGG